MEENQNPEQNQQQSQTQNVDSSSAQSTNNNQYQSPKKSSNTGLIVIIFILLIVIIAGGVYGYMTITDLQKKLDEKTNISYDENNKENEEDKKDSKEEKDKDDDKEEKNETKSNKTESKENTSSKGAKASTVENPLKLGEWGLASKRVSKYLSEEYADKEAVDVPVRVTKVTRGEDAQKEVKEWFDNQKFYKYEEPKAHTEWVVIDYEVDLSGLTFDQGTIGINSYVDSAVKGTDGSSVKYNNITYILSTKDITGSDYVKKPEVYKCKFIVTLPEGCKDYLVKLGSSYNGAESYFKCE